MANTAGAQAPIGNGQTLNAVAARYWLALVARIKAETGIDIVATEGTRDYARQKYLYDGYRAGRKGFNPAWSPDSPFAYHLSGRAVDVGSGVGYLITSASRAFYALAGVYGFRPTVKGETWHFEWRADWVGISLETASLDRVTIPQPQSEEDDDMFKPAFVRNTRSGAVAFLFPDRVKVAKDEAEIYRLGRAYGLLKPGQNGSKYLDEKVVNNLDPTEYDAAVTEINAARTLTRAEVVRDLKSAR
jgi:hypothetical protein